MNNVQTSLRSIVWTRQLATVVVFFSLIGATGCDPCLNNPCNDGLACNGVEMCSADGGTFNCTDGIPVTCDNGTACTEPDGACPECDSDDDCDDSDLCTTDTCEADGSCTNVDVMCPAGETCDPGTGNCMASDTVSPQSLVGAAGNYTGATSCGDDDDMVSVVNNNGVLTLTGLTGNEDITISLTGDLTGTASGVTAFGVGDHTLMLTLDPANGNLSLHLENGDGGSCDSTLVSMP